MAIDILRVGANLEQHGLKNAGWTDLALKDKSTKPHVQTLDFPTEDPWSYWMRATITDLANRGAFKGKSVTEFGAGDLRNIRVVETDIASFRAVEIDPKRIEIARANLSLDPVLRSIPHELIESDAVEFLDKWATQRSGEKIDGWAFMCLPQSPQGENTADAYDSNTYRLSPYRAKWENSGLTLNAAVLDKLNKVASARLQVLVVNSHRVQDKIREDLLEQTGWDIETEYISEPIQQDPDTPIGWIHKAELDDGKRFFEKTENGLLVPIPAQEAEFRRVEAVISGKGRERLNVYHKLSFYQLIPARKFMVTGLGVNGKNAA